MSATSLESLTFFENLMTKKVHVQEVVVELLGENLMALIRFINFNDFFLGLKNSSCPSKYFKDDDDLNFRIQLHHFHHYFKFKNFYDIFLIYYT